MCVSIFIWTPQMAFYNKYRKNYQKKKSYLRARGKYARKRSRSTFQQRVTRVLMKKAETKLYDTSYENTQLYHDTVTVPIFNPWDQITKGTNENQRVGDEIYPRGYKLRLWLSNKSDRPNVTYRVIIGIAPRSVGATAVTSANIQNYLFRPPDLGTGSNGLLEPVSTDNGFKTLVDKRYRNNIAQSYMGTAVFKEHAIYKDYFIKRKGGGKILYTGNTIKNKFFFVAIVAYDSFGTLFTDNIASFAWHGRMYWKDI